jgi:serine/threonine-protein kinase
MSKHRFTQGNLLANRYEIRSFHAAGGMQEVYLAYDRTLNREVALKTPKPGVTDRRFRRGAEMGARVKHSNVAATFDYFENEEITFLVEEFIPGQDLGKRLENDFFFMDPYLAARTLHHISKALNEAHKVNICHRDLKPSNIMTSDDIGLQDIKLTDFGIAKLAENEIAAEMELFDKDHSTLTSSNTLLGAVPYMSPECWTDWKGAGQPMDIWAFGCIAYHILTGAPPFGEGRLAIMNVARLFHTKPDLQKPNWFGKHPSTGPLEDDLWEIICACIKVNPEERPSAEELLQLCNNLCYSLTPRRIGTVQQFPGRYRNGTQGNFGFINDLEISKSWFFHATEVFGIEKIKTGDLVSFSTYPGLPNDRCSPILVLKSDN